MAQSGQRTKFWKRPGVAVVGNGKSVSWDRKSAAIMSAALTLILAIWYANTPEAMAQTETIDRRSSTTNHQPRSWAKQNLRYVSIGNNSAAVNVFLKGVLGQVAIRTRLQILRSYTEGDIIIISEDQVFNRIKNSPSDFLALGFPRDILAQVSKLHNESFQCMAGVNVNKLNQIINAYIISSKNNEECISNNVMYIFGGKRSTSTIDLDQLCTLYAINWVAFIEHSTQEPSSQPILYRAAQECKLKSAQ